MENADLKKQLAARTTMRVGPHWLKLRASAGKKQYDNEAIFSVAN